MATPTKKSGQKKTKRNVPNGVVHIQSTFNNTIVSITDTSGEVISWSSAGASGFKGARKGTPFAAQTAAEAAARRALEQGMRQIEVLVRGPGSGREPAIRALQVAGLEITLIRDVEKGIGVSYGHNFITQRPSRLAVVSIGYADGMPVSIKDGTKVIINNQEAEVFGKVSMDLTTVNVSNIDNCKLGDWCEFFSPNLPISNIAKSNDLISYYLMTSIKSRVKKVYKSLK